MSRNITFLLLAAAPLALSACGTPQERCIRKHTVEYRNVSKLLAEVEGNLARGYAWEERDVTRTILGTCNEIVRDKKGKPRIVATPCWKDVTDTERYRVPIDPQSEARKRDNLAARKAKLSDSAAAYTRACKEAFPDEEPAKLNPDAITVK